MSGTALTGAGLYLTCPRTDAVQAGGVPADRCWSQEEAIAMPRFNARSLVVTMLAGVALATGCGGSTTSATTSSSPAAAVPAGALLYADVNLDHGSSGWRQFVAVTKRFPGWQKLADKMTGSFCGQTTAGGAYASISSWLGNSAGAAMTSVDASSGTPRWILFVASKNDGKAKGLLDKGCKSRPDGSYNGYAQYRSTGSGGEIAVGDGAVISASDTQTLHDAIDVRAGKASSLADDSTFRATMARLPATSLVRGYADPGKLAQLASLAQLSGQTSALSAQKLSSMASSLQSFDSASFAMYASAGGYNAVFHVRLKDGADPGMLGSQSAGQPLTLTSLVPRDAFLFLGSRLSGTDFTKAFTQGFNGASGGIQMQQFEQMTGISISRDIAPLFSGELLLYGAPGLPARGALLLKPSNPAAATAGLEHIMAFIKRSQPQLHVHPLGGGRVGETLQATPGLTLSWERKGGLIAIGNDSAAGSTAQGSLLDSPDYTRLLSETDLPSGANVVAYVSVPSILRMVPITVDPNVRPLGGMLEWGSRSGNDLSFGLFAEIK
jgi:hypothetical protein